ncbi:RluA family pseudouridine synthase [Caloranaerobacter azorensis]|uniref:Pseudouridine synthase n=1 Tax=Caloranaerobacter azorensis TaxID=116090 RepID=A0A6P1YA82_9FIRM|nr:RluA family pseudouridine synthase [Caloranaerobacter azorensis]QIB26270.1 RluA family pseudouridine synthase [Caloranaerobacter azorensis]
MDIIELVVEDDIDERVDSYLAKKLEEASRSYIKKLIKDGHIKVNNLQVKPKYVVNKGDVITVELPEPEKLELIPQDLPIEIVYEDEDVAVVNKPRGMVVHPAPGNYSGTLVNALLYHLESLSTINGVVRPGIVHRIDKDTSGLLMIAKNDFAHIELSKQLKEHSITRIYYALVEGNIKVDNGTINAPIGRHPVDRKKMAVTDRNSKRAITHFKVLERFGQYTLIEAKLETGRTHQIRVHMSHIKHPLVGDLVYGSKKNEFKQEGQLLHAKVIGFIHPRTKEYMEFDSELPDYFKKVLDVLRRKNYRHN